MQEMLTMQIGEVKTKGACSLGVRALKRAGASTTAHSLRSARCKWSGPAELSNDLRGQCARRPRRAETMARESHGARKRDGQIGLRGARLKSQRSCVTAKSFDSQILT
jgi:hypothetical protein